MKLIKNKIKIYLLRIEKLYYICSIIKNNMKQTELKNGQDFHFDNEQWCEQNLSDDLRCGWITWNDRFNWFSIHFNGACIHTSKTFNSAKKRLEKLMGDWECEFTLDTKN